MTSTSRLTVDEFALAEFDQVHDLWQRSGLWMRPSDDREHVLLKLQRDPDLFLVAHEPAGRAIGVVLGGWDGRRAYVYHLAVDPDWRRRGVGDALMDELERRLVARGALKCKCQVVVGNEASAAFFRRRGYEAEDFCLPYGKELVPGGAPNDGGCQG